MRTVSIGIRDAKINLCKLLKEVQKGAEVIITDRNKPVGRIVPVSAEENLSLAERIASLEREGLIQPAKKKKARNLPPPLPLPGELARKMLEEDRG
ncbi:prevent-host-death protein [Peptococcaceae bacterium SCADC1_2_3]|jgi:prevent-host-death family protein|nr:prevent-host-death protein [Peptococcaceae bacterium SCADC1_2_3]